jgi:hypothetical protein
MKDEESSPHRAMFGLLHQIKVLHHDVHLGLNDGSLLLLWRCCLEFAGIWIPIWLGVQAGTFGAILRV